MCPLSRLFQTRQCWSAHDFGILKWHQKLIQFFPSPAPSVVLQVVLLSALLLRWTALDVSSNFEPGMARVFVAGCCSSCGEIKLGNLHDRSSLSAEFTG